MIHEEGDEDIVNVLIFLVDFLLLLFEQVDSSPNIPNKFGVYNVDDDEVINDMEGTRRDATNGMEINLDEVS